MFGTDKHDSNDTRLKQLFWKELQSDRTLMLGLEGVEDDRTRPMTAQVDLAEGADKEDGGDIYFFASRNEGVGHDLKQGARAIATFVSKGHGLFASLHGTLHDATTEREVIDRLWNPFASVWYKDGKDDPNLLLIRFKATRAELWESDGLGTLKAAALKWAFNLDPGKEQQKEHSAEVKL
ncbi:MAG: pyridoxamine 5'-phosphate oxidase family protein [Sphingomicrobium sp.]